MDTLGFLVLASPDHGAKTMACHSHRAALVRPQSRCLLRLCNWAFICLTLVQVLRLGVSLDLGLTVAELLNTQCAGGGPSPYWANLPVKGMLWVWCAPCWHSVQWTWWGHLESLSTPPSLPHITSQVVGGGSDLPFIPLSWEGVIGGGPAQDGRNLAAATGWLWLADWCVSTRRRPLTTLLSNWMSSGKHEQVGARASTV